MLIDDYVNYLTTYRKKYGKCILLYQNGSFFEIYNIDPLDNELQKICELLNIQFTRKNKAILEISKSNPSLAGFPLASLKKYLTVLLNNNFTVVLVEQTTEPPNPKREITNIYSPSTYIEHINEPYSNIIVSLYILQEQCFKTMKKIFIYALCNIDISTGYCSVYQSNNYMYDKNEMFNDISRYIETNNCKELIVNTHNVQDFTLEDLKRNIITNNRMIHFNFNNLEKEYFQCSYQNNFLKKIYNETGFLSPIEYLNLEKHQETIIPFIVLLNFCYEHNENIIKKIKIPSFYEYNEHLILHNNAIYQLDIIEHNKYKNNDCNYKSLFNIINKCSTNIGKRLLHYRLLNPITNKLKLNERYNQIEYILNSGKLEELEIILKNIVDIERLHRKITLKMLQPHEYFTLTYSYNNILKLLFIIDNKDMFGIDDNLIENYKKYIIYYTHIFDLNELAKCGLNNINHSFFNKNIYIEVDNIQDEINIINKYFENECIYLSNFIENGSDFVKLENNDRDGYFFYTTKNRSDIMLKKMNEEEKSKYEIKKYNGSNIKIVSNQLYKNSNKLIELQDKIQKVIKEKYLEVLTYIDENFKQLFNEICRFIAIIDISKSGAKCSLTYNYSKPNIIDKYNGESYFIALEIRHPIIEIINEQYDYIKNDIELLKGNGNYSSLLLYGLNSAGKSSLIKAICLNIILCQMGYYCACKDFTFYPYNQMFVRISSDDNIYKNLSSYALEISELRSIINYADSKSIVISDELCKATESVSGIAICASTLLHFSQKNINYINTTHLHELYELEDIKKLKNLAIKYIKVEYDEKNDNIIYLRKLENGIPPNKYYGLEFASYLIKNNDFIKCAFDIRNQLLKQNSEILTSKTSNYNSDLYMDKCLICGDQGNSYPLDCHHIKFQKFFNEYDINKNKLSNLVVLCKKHHDQLHNSDLNINGYKDTIKGKILDYHITNKDNQDDKDNKKRKKYSEKEQELIKELSKKFGTSKNLIIELKNNHNITMSPSTLKKILDNLY